MPARYRVIVQGIRAPGRLDPVTGMLNAVRGLGHPTMHVDPTVDVHSLRSALERFRPHLLVRVAADPRLRRDELAVLHDHEVLALGWQIDGTADSAAGLDLIAGTHVHDGDAVLHLPLAVDAAILRQRLPPDAGPAEPVLVLGHATKDAEAHRLAAELVSELGAVTYGPGWPEGWRGSPDGVHLLQVLRRGRVHVHVTAGSVPLLSVAAGGVVAASDTGLVTAQLDDLELPEEARIRFTDPAGAVEAVRRALTDPEQVARAQAESRRWLLGGHLYEHRWASLLEELERRADEARDLPDPGLAARIIDVAQREDHAPARRVIVSGWYGAGNAGDELILDTLARHVEAGVPGAQVVVSARRPAAVLLRHGLEAFDASDRALAEEEASRAAAVLLGGGGLWEDYTFARNGGVAGIVDGAVAGPAALAVLPLLASVHRRPVHVVGLGVGPLTDPGAQAVVRRVAGLAESVTVRDPASRDQLLAIPGWDSPVDVAPDVVYAFEPRTLPDARIERQPGRRVVAVNLRPWGEQGSDAAGEIIAALEQLVRSRDVVLVGLPLSPDDAARLATVLPSVLAEHVLLPPPADPVQLLADLRACDAVLAMRLHACLLAHRAGTPVVGLGYDPKVRAHFEELGRAEWVVPLVEHARTLSGLLEAALDEGLPNHVGDRVAELEKRSSAALTAVVTRLRTTEAPPEPTRSLPWTDDATPGRLTLRPSPDEVTGGSVVDRRRAPRLQRARDRGDLVVGLGEAALLAGDFAEWSAVVPAAGGGSGRRVELTLQSPELEDPDAMGWLVWQVILEGRVVLAEDVAGWREPVTSWLGWGAAQGDVRLQVRVLVLRDCGGRQWRRASALRVSSVRAHLWPGGATLPEGQWVVTSSSPGAALLT